MSNEQRACPPPSLSLSLSFVGPLPTALLFHLSFFNSFSARILQFSVFYPLFSSRSSSPLLLLFSVLLRSSLARSRPPILLTNARNPSVPPVHRNPPFLHYSVEGDLSLPFFPSLFVLTRHYPLSLAFGAPPRQ